MVSRDKIILKGMQFYGYHGVLPQETELGQRFEVDVELELDTESAGRADDKDLTVSYADVFKVVEAVITGPPKNLIEAVAQSVADAILERFSVGGVLVRVKKTWAPVAGSFAYMAVEIRRGKVYDR